METSTKKNPLINIVSKLSKSLDASLKHEQRWVVPDRYVILQVNWTGEGQWLIRTGVQDY